MVTCNLCEINKEVKEFDKTSFAYVCNECWDDCTVGIMGHEVDKELMY